jgi:predicted mannosyl-3-phosphoglycerate phosphatase (HAD superfamily)
MPRKPKVMVDFDGVIHQYSKGWGDGTIYDPPVPGAKNTLQALEDEGYQIVVFSTRDASQIVPWLKKFEFPAYRVTNQKEGAAAYIDDRAIEFKDWYSAANQLRKRYPVNSEEN